MVLTARTVHRLAQAAAVAVLVMGLSVLAGWVLADAGGARLPWLMRDIKANAALGLALLAGSWLLPFRSRLAAVLTAATATIAVVTLVEFAVGAGSGFDQLIATDDSSRHGRMRLAAALCLLALAAARVLLTGAEPARHPWRTRVSQMLSLLVVAVSGIATIGYVFYEATAGPEGGIGFLPLLVSVGLLVLAHVALAGVPHGFVSWMATGQDSGAALVRRVLPVAAFAVPAVNLAVVLARSAGWLPYGVGAPIAAITIMFVVSLALGYTARALRASDRSREQASQALTAVNYDLELRVRERAEQLQAERATSDILLERDRIAADMHDHVIQRLYGLGLDLERRAIAANFDADSTLDGIDAAIADLRRTIHDLRTAPPAHGLEAALRELVHAAGDAFTRLPGLTISGDLDTIRDEVRLNLLAVAREAVSNAVRHADAEQLDLTLVVDADGVTFTVEDDGRGIPDGIESTSGLRNIRDRAAQCGGIATWQQRSTGGTVMTWFAAANDDSVRSEPTQDVLPDAISRFAAHLSHGLHRDRLPFAAEQLCGLLSADAATALTPHTDGLHVDWSTGFPPGALPDDSVYPYAGSLTGHVATTRRPVRVAQLAAAPVAMTASAAAAPFGPSLAIPVAGPQRLHGVLALLRAQDAEPFTAADEYSALLFATCVANLLDQHAAAAGAADAAQPHRFDPHDLARPQ